MDWGSFAKYGLAGAGGVAGGIFGGPAGATLGASAGYGLGSALGNSDEFDRTKRAEALYGYQGGNTGLPGFDRQYNNYGEMGRAYGRQDPYFSKFRGQQQGLGELLAAEARGKGVGQQLVGMQARQAANRASAQQFGAAQAARPGMEAMAARNAMLGSAVAQSAVGEQAALGSAQMTLGAQGQYGQFLQGARGQDEGTVMAQRQLNNQSQLEAYRQRLLLSQAQQQGGLQGEAYRTSRYNALLGSPTQGEIALGGVVGGLGAASKMPWKWGA